MDFVWCAHGDAYAELCARSQETVKKHSKDPRFTVYVDKPYGLEGEHVVKSYHSAPFMLMNVMCQAHFLATKGCTEEMTAFLDVDAFMMAPLEFDTSETWDVGVTWRDNMGDLSMLMPYNYGVVFARQNVQAVASWFWMCNRITHMSPKNQGWYGNQVALRELCGPTIPSGEVQTRDHQYFDVRVKHFPCEQYNWTPDDTNPRVEPVGKVFVHFKGNRKDLSDYYYERAMA